MKKTILAFAVACLGLSVNGFSQTVYIQDFESSSIPSLPAGVTQSSPSGASGWVTNSGTVSWYGQWTIPAHTNYAMVNDAPSASLTNTADKMNTATFSMGALTHPYLSFDFFFVGAFRSTGGTGIREQSWVNVSGDGGTTWTTVDTLKGNNGAGWQTNSLNLAAYVGMTNVIVQFFYYDGGDQLTGVAIDNIKVYQPAAWDAGISNLTPVKENIGSYYMLSSSAALGGTIFNNGYNTITTINVNYKQNSGTLVTSPLSVSIAPFTSYTFTSLSAPYAVPATVGNYNVSVWLSLAGDVNPANDTVKTQIGAVSSFGNKQITFEEATGTWCGWCVRGAVYMDSFAKANPGKATQIAVHNGDSMSLFTANTTAYDGLMGSLMNTATPINGANPGYPNMLVDRRELSDPSTIFSVYNSEKNSFAFANLSMTAPVVTSGNVTTTVTVTPLTNLQGDIRIAAVLTEFTLHGGPDNQPSGWDQHNYYSTAWWVAYYGPSVPPPGAMGGFQNLTNPVPASKMFYDFVARGSFPDVHGYPSSLPTAMTAGTPYTYNVSVAIPSRVKQSKMIVSLLLIRQSDGTILNSIASANAPAGVPNTNTTAGVDGLLIFPNPTANQAFIKFDLAQTGNVEVTVTDMVGHTVYSTSNHMSVGTQQMSINTASFANGVYNINIKTANGSITDRLSVIK